MKFENSQPDADIVGFWKVIGGDYPLINEYRSDGTLIQHIGNRAGKPIPFRTDGNCIISFLEQPDGRIYEEKKQFLVSENTLTLIYSAKKKMQFQRVDEV